MVAGLDDGAVYTIGPDGTTTVLLKEIDGLWKEASIRETLRNKVADAEGRARADWSRSLRKTA